MLDPIREELDFHPPFSSYCYILFEYEWRRKLDKYFMFLVLYIYTCAKEREISEREKHMKHTFINPAE